jgi:hypothetical protein
MRFRALPPAGPLPVAGPGLSRTFLRAPCLGASGPADDSTAPEPSVPGEPMTLMRENGVRSQGLPNRRHLDPHQLAAPDGTEALVERHWPTIERTANAVLSGRPLDQERARRADRRSPRVDDPREGGPMRAFTDIGKRGQGAICGIGPCLSGPSRPGRILSLPSRAWGLRSTGFPKGPSSRASAVERTPGRSVTGYGVKADMLGECLAACRTWRII